MEANGFHENARHDLGREMVDQAYRDVDLKNVPYKKKKYPIAGFKAALTANGQDADVYHHILFTAGDTLHGTFFGDAENWAFGTYDWIQAKSGRQESVAELADDAAGTEVGTLMYNAAMAGQSANYQELEKQIFKILCDF